MSGKTRRGNGEDSVYQDKNRVWHAKIAYKIRDIYARKVDSWPV